MRLNQQKSQLIHDLIIEKLSKNEALDQRTRLLLGEILEEVKIKEIPQFKGTLKALKDL